MGRLSLSALAVAVLTVLSFSSPQLASAAGPPEVQASWVEGVTTTTANLRGEIDPNGLNTTYRFEYLTQARFEDDGWAAPALAPPSGKAPYGSSPGLLVFQHLEHLAPATEYRYRLLATNEAATTISPEHVLATEQAQISPACPNDALRVGLGEDLPDCRAYELVSPPDKAGGAIAAPGRLFGGGTIQAASSTAEITYGSATSFGAALGAPPASQYTSRRTATGWVTENISAPLESSAYGDHPDGVPYRLFSTDLSTGILFGGLPCRGEFPGCPVPNPVLAGSGAPPGYMAYYLRSASGSYASLLSATNLSHTAVTPENFRVALAATSPDLSRMVLSTCTALTADAAEVVSGPGHCDPGAQNLYEWSGGELALINLLPGDAVGTPGAEIAAPLGAVSADGTPVYWTLGSNLYLRNGDQSLQIDAAQGGGGVFQAASADGALAFFSKGGHLYRYSLATGLADDLTPAGGLSGVLAVSADGAHVYYQDETGLWHWHQGVSTEIASGADVALFSDYPPGTGTSRLSADGLHLAFLSDAEIPPFDNLDANTGQPDTELYLYGPPPAGGTAKLVCASCNPTGERPRGSASIPGVLVNGSTTAYRPRALVAGGHRVFFDSSDRLVSADTDARPDVYQWQAEGIGDCHRSPGCVSPISGGRQAGGSFLDASADGSDVYFLTADSLVPSDPGSIDVYDARVGGGFPEPQPPIPCIGDACQALPNPPDDPSPGTVVPNSGNPARKYFKPHKKRHHRKRKKRHRHHRGGR